MQADGKFKFSGLGQMVKGVHQMSNICMRSYEVYAVCGQMGNSFHHLSKLCAETGQVVKYEFIIPKFYFETEQMQKTTTNIPMSQLCLLACFKISSVISVKS